ncbi:hypothetical protein GHJ82_28305 [Sinorhizobium saheli]|nr:hypothetical protein [Sinorhizobium saheli]
MPAATRHPGSPDTRSRLRSHAFAPPLSLFVFAAFARRQVIPPDCKMLESGLRQDARAAANC